MTPIGFDILYEQGPCLVVMKPAGLLTQAPPYIDSLERRVKQYLKERDRKAGRVYLGVPHRLDRPVSGLLVMAKHVRAARRLSSQFERRMVDKFYWALLQGDLPHDTGRWSDQLRKVPDQAQAEVVTGEHPDGRDAVLQYRVLERCDGRTFVEVQLDTGRYHQIRVQAAARGSPVVGDQQYGATTSFGPVVEDRRAQAIALHARRLTFYHPMTRARTTIDAPLPSYWPDVRN